MNAHFATEFALVVRIALSAGHGLFAVLSNAVRFHFQPNQPASGLCFSVALNP
jgi:hypothetical protein